MITTLENPARADNEVAKGAKSCAHTGYVAPKVTIVETAEGYVLEADMPGVNKEGLAVTITGNELTITGRRHREALPGQALFRESSVTDFRRVFELGDNVDTAKVSGRIEQGLLTVTLPKAESAKPRRIEVA